MFDLIDDLFRFMGDLFEPDPYQDGTANVISDNTSFATLATFETGELFGFSVKLLNLPTEAAHLLHGLGVILSKVVGDDIVRALRRQHQPEQFHLVVFGETLEVDDLAMPAFLIRPLQPIHAAVRQNCARIIHLAVILERTIINLFQTLNQQHHL